MERDTDADKLGLAVAFLVFPLAMAVAGVILWPMFHSAGDSTHQVYDLKEIGVGFIGGGAVGAVIGAILLYVRSKTETPAENGHH
ncbi:MAG: hypothetical protein BGO01_02640 [Armatimonadetes bacterium 55-13]|nr:hypothetical protein [Armatimonadota bacterium]ODU54032.1 MAG: hypothetical protein ABT09_00500 [bacterium SCN 57-13]OJU62151.1 MAG: hypothetical protein BGO01_02640 [Armatimonadetes bacterium 55-13]